MPEIKFLEVCVMPQGEIICAGKTVGWVKDLGKYLYETAQKKPDPKDYSGFDD